MCGGGGGGEAGEAAAFIGSLSILLLLLLLAAKTVGKVKVESCRSCSLPSFVPPPSLFASKLLACSLCERNHMGENDVDDAVACVCVEK